MAEIQQKVDTQKDKIYFERKTIGQSFEHRPLEMFTLCSRKALEANKPVCIFSCRVHSGETPASYMLQGCIDMLTNFSDKQSMVLLDNYIFKMIPMLNPDGVARGNWRFDTLG